MIIEGQDNEDMIERKKRFKIEDTFTYEKYPVNFFDIFQKGGIPLRTTISEMGPQLLSTVLVIVLNIVILAVISANQTANGRPWTTARETGEALQKTETGYVLSDDISEKLNKEIGNIYFELVPEVED